MTSSLHPQDVYVPPTPRDEGSYYRAYMHANARLTERYGLHLEFDEYVNLCRELAEVPGHQLNRARTNHFDKDRVLLNIRLCGMATRAVWSLRTGVIVTWIFPYSKGTGNVEHVE